MILNDLNVYLNVWFVKLRMLTDPGQMEELMAKLLNNAGDPGETSRKLNGAEAAAKEAEDLHKRQRLTRS